jgi:hypothetical protein
MGRAYSTNKEKINVHRVLVGKPEGKSPLVRRRSRRNNIKMDLREREGGMVWIGLIWLRIGTSGELL